MGIKKKIVARPVIAYNRMWCKLYKAVAEVSGSKTMALAVELSGDVQRSWEGWASGYLTSPFPTEAWLEDRGKELQLTVLADSKRTLDKATRVAELSIAFLDAASESLEEIEEEVITLHQEELLAAYRKDS